MLTFFSLTGLFNQGNVFRSSNRDFLCRGSLVLHRVSVSSSNGCVRLRWLFERFKYRGCLELWIDGRGWVQFQLGDSRVYSYSKSRFVNSIG